MLQSPTATNVINPSIQWALIKKFPQPLNVNLKP
jgi:hypothetical protein